MTPNKSRPAGTGRYKICENDFPLPLPIPRKGKDWKLRLAYPLAKEHCANFCRDESCKGIGFNLGKGRCCRPRIGSDGRCGLASDQPCSYFEEAVLPMEKRREKDWPDFATGKRFREGARVYHEVFPETLAPPVPVTEPLGQADFERAMAERLRCDNRKCLVCGKRSAEPGEQPCPKCRAAQEREAKTERQRRWRQKGVM